MASFTDQELAIGRVYAGAMLQLAEAAGVTDTLHDELQDLAGRVAIDAEFRTFLSSPMIDVAARRMTLEKLFRGRYSDLLVDALQVLNRKGRIGLIGAVAEGYRESRDEVRGRVQVHVQSAVPLTSDHRDRIREVAQRRSGKAAELVETVDPSLIGGLVIRIDDEKLDVSVATKLRTLAASLMDRASREIHSGRVYVEGAPT